MLPSTQHSLRVHFHYYAILVVISLGWESTFEYVSLTFFLDRSIGLIIIV